MLMLLIINLVVLPVAIAFFNEENSHSWAVFNCVNDSIFILDILLNFRTGIPRQHMAVQVVLEPKVIRASYMRGWFGIDLISSMPMDYIFLIISQGDSGGPQILNASRTLKMLRLMKFLSLMRLLRVSRLMRYATQWEDVFNLASAAIRILNLIFMMVLISHWNGCLMFLFPRIYDFPPDSWVVIDGLKDSEWEEQYSWALFRAMSHMLCIGYGQQPPTSLMDLWLVMVSMLSGATCYALFIGHATNMIQQFDSSRRQYTEKMKQVEEYMGHRKLRPDLQVRVHEYYEYKYKGKMFDEEVILEELNDCLREEILNYNCRELVNVVPFFQGADPLFVSGVVSKLKFEVFQPGDLILSEGSFGTKMYFIQQGTVDVLSMDDDVIAQLTDGAYFGEICLLTKCRRTASIRAESYCNLYSLEVEDFNDVVREFPEVRDKMEQVARLRLTQLGRKPSQVFLKSKFKPHSLINSLILNTHSNMRSHDNNNNNNNSDNDNSDGETHDVHINDELVSNVARLTMRKLSVLLESTHPSGCSPTRTNNSSGHSSAAGTHANNNNNTISPKLAKSPKQGNHFTCHAKVDHCDTILESECGSGEQMSQSLISSHRHSNAADHTDQEVEGGRSSQVGAKMYSGTAYADNGFDDTICEDPIDDDDIDIDLDFGNAENFDDFCDDADDDENTEADVISDAVIREMKSMLNSGGQVNDSSAPNTHEQTEDLDDQNKNTVDEYSQFHLSPSCPTFLGIRQQSTDSSNI
ncbi:potassium/sodium hyperpolarization-activated cyclic nucleotide-gated channel 1-like [Symsagittifera roscoffensis]|uniref:potassium/sodium hyperpolarization-activated cyclic nucleotide-gated channel 1-like n=1 Tax=Symsagittifera roscoffensis TaxID=84072 RepID=UPI00307B3CE8